MNRDPQPSEWPGSTSASASGPSRPGSPGEPAGYAGFASDAFEPATFEVLELRGSEALAEPFDFELTLLSTRCDLDAAAALREHACLRIHPAGCGPSVPYHGVLARFEQLHSTDSHTLYRARLVPRLWRLGLSRRCRSFTTEQPITDTLRQILLDAGLHDTCLRLRQPDSYRPRSFVCQYDESDLDFVHRWMQREGLFYLFEHDAGAERMLVLDHNALLPAHCTAVLWRPHQHMPTSHDQPAAHDWHALHAPLPRKLVLLQHNYRKARVDLSARAQVCPDGFGELAIDHISFRDHDEGQRYASVHAQQLLCQARRFTARSTSCGLRCGQFVELRHHPRADFNRRYLITRVTHHAQRCTPSQPGSDISYACTLELIAHDTAFRPQPLTPWPRIPGTVGATVQTSCASSPYAELDEHGRYSIRLHFDLRDDNPQPCARVRMATPYAGSGHGMHMPLLAGTEVLVAFCDGLPDEPVITAAVPDSENPSLVNRLNPSQHHIRSAAGNHIQLSDRAGQPSIWISCPAHHTCIGLGQLSSPQAPAQPLATPHSGGAGGADTADAQDQGGFHVQTKGSMYSVVAGTQLDVLGGSRNAARLGYHGKMVGGADSFLGIGGSIQWSAGYAMSWGGGSAQDISGTSSYLQSPSIRFAADDAVTLNAGLSPRAVAAIQSARRRAQATAGAGALMDAGFASQLLLRDTPSDSDEPETAMDHIRQWGTPAAAIGSALYAQKVLKSHADQAAQAGIDAQAADLELQAERTRLRYRPDNGPRERSLLLGPQGAELRSSPDPEAAPRAWSFQPDQCSATAGEARLQLQAKPARMRLEAGPRTRMELGATRLALRCTERSGLSADATGQLRFTSVTATMRSFKLIWLG